MEGPQSASENPGLTKKHCQDSQVTLCGQLCCPGLPDPLYRHVVAWGMPAGPSLQVQEEPERVFVSVSAMRLVEFVQNKPVQSLPSAWLRLLPPASDAPQFTPALLYGQLLCISFPQISHTPVPRHKLPETRGWNFTTFVSSGDKTVRMNE